MTLNVQITGADYHEAHAAVRGQKLQSISYLSVFYVFLALSIGSMIGGFLQPQPVGAPPQGAVEVVVSSLPLLFISAYWGIVMLRTRGRKAYGFVKPPPPLTGMGVTIPAVICAAVFLISIASHAMTPAMPVPKGPTPTAPIGVALANVVLPLTPIVAFLIASIWMAVRLHSRNITRAFELLVHLHQPRTYQFEPERVVVSDQDRRTEYLWSAFIGWNETPHLVLLYTSYITFELIPKRVFASSVELGAFLDLIREKIGQLRRGFDLLPVRADLPLGPGTEGHKGPPPLPAGYVRDGRGGTD